MQIESAMGGSYRDRAKERRSKFGDDIPPGDNYDNYNDDYRYFYIYQDPDGEIENSEKSIFEIRIPNLCYIQVIVFDLKLSTSGSGWDLASTLP